ncbi:E3 ubiquitin-protein ligase MIB2-like isoform X2, partial [Leptotrombidium deliense]
MGNKHSRTKFQTLLECSTRGQTTAVQRLINDGVKLDKRDPETGDTAVHRAVMRNQSEVLSILLINGANGNILNGNYETALSIAVEKLLPECVDLLVQNKCNVNVVTKGGVTAFHRALIKYDYHVKYGSDSRLLNRILVTLVNAPKLFLDNEDGYRCLELAIRCELLFIVRRILERFPSLLRFTIFDETIMKKLILFGNYSQKLSCLLLKETMLYWAIRCCHPFAVEFLVSNGANCNMLSENRGTLLHLSFSLLDTHPTLRVTFPHSTTRIANIYNSLQERNECCKRRLAVALYLVEFGNGNISVRDNDGKTPFDVIEITDVEEKMVVKDLLERCVDRMKNNVSQELKQHFATSIIEHNDMREGSEIENSKSICCKTFTKENELEEEIKT